MPRRPRIHVAGGIYHVILRGNAREPIFFTETDRNHLNALVAEGLNRYFCRLHAFCWMTNHLHAAIQVSDRPLSNLMCWLGSRYARHINRSRNRTGHLFERRHRAELVSDDEYMLNLVRYIHYNPVNAGMAAEPIQYRWSSHRAYLGVETVPWVTTRPVLSCFGTSMTKARHQYRQFMDTDPNWKPDDQSRENDEPLRIDEFSFHSTASDLEQRLGKLVEFYCAESGLDPATVVGPGKRRDAARTRALISGHALSNGDATLSELVGYFHRAPEVIMRAIARYCDAPPAKRVK